MDALTTEEKMRTAPEFKPYPVYKESGVPWLGEVPAHWNVRRLKSSITRNDSGFWGSDFSSTGTLVLRSNEQTIDGRWRIGVPARRSLTDREKLGSRLSTGDLLITKASGSANHIGKTSLVTKEIEAMGCCFSNFMQRVRMNHQLEPKIAWYWLNSVLGREQLAHASSTTTGLANLNGTIIGNFLLALPPLAEQSAIARFLDHSDRRIQRHILAKKKLIALLNEQKQAIIHRAVTRGLDPAVRLKPSCVEWLGDVPEHWEVVPLRRRWAVTDCKHLTVPFTENGIPLVSVREVQSFDLSLARAKRTTREWYETLTEGGRAPRQGDLVYCRNVSVGAAAFVNTDEPVAMGQDVCLIRSTCENQRYLNYFLHSPAMDRQLASMLVGSTFDRINLSEINALIVAVPPRQEQDAIAEHLDRCLRVFEQGTENARREASLLGEYRTRLIADVVTGKLDVREAAARLPDEVEEPEVLDEGEALVEYGEEEVDGADLDASSEEAVA